MESDPNLHQFTARALYPNVNRTLLPGRYASVLLKKDEIPNAIAIPTEAIVPEMGKDKVYLYKSGKAEPVDIITGIRTASEVQVIRGLHVGDTIITSGTLQLRTGLAVTLDNIEEWEFMIYEFWFMIYKPNNLWFISQQNTANIQKSEIIIQKSEIFNP